MTASVPLSDSWIDNLDRDTQAKVVEAGELVIILKLMALDRQMQQTLSSMRAAEVDRDEELVETLSRLYMRQMKRKQGLQSKDGRLDFLDSLLQDYWEGRKQERSKQNATSQSGAPGV